MTGAIVRSAVCGAAAGFLMRPCCVIPAVLSMLGIGSAGASAVIATHRAEFLLASAGLLAASSWITLRREGGRLARSA
jgi:hypothetical protein